MRPKSFDQVTVSPFCWVSPPPTSPRRLCDPGPAQADWPLLGWAPLTPAGTPLPPSCSSKSDQFCLWWKLTAPYPLPSGNYLTLSNARVPLCFSSFSFCPSHTQCIDPLPVMPDSWPFPSLTLHLCTSPAFAQDVPPPRIHFLPMP